MRGFDSPSTHNSVFEDTTLFNLNFNNMTRLDVIAMTFKEPVRNWIIDNVIEQRGEEWLERIADDFGTPYGMPSPKSYRVLDHAFCWEDSKEGHNFWKEIFNKLKADRR
jgi:hypothetical protein